MADKKKNVLDDYNADSKLLVIEDDHNVTEESCYSKNINHTTDIEDTDNNQFHDLQNINIASSKFDSGIDDVEYSSNIFNAHELLKAEFKDVTIEYQDDLEDIFNSRLSTNIIQNNQNQITRSAKKVSKNGKCRLGVNIDHFASIRNLRNNSSINLQNIINYLLDIGVEQITAHLRLDRRHIQDEDIIMISELRKTRDFLFNFEISIDQSIVDFATFIKPDSVCIVPENRQEQTTEGGLNINNNIEQLKVITSQMYALGVETYAFIEPDLEDIYSASCLPFTGIEIHTGSYANLDHSMQKKEALRIAEIVKIAYEKYNLEVHAGHGLALDNLLEICKIHYINELNIGYAIVTDSVLYGIDASVNKYLKLINEARAKL